MISHLTTDIRWKGFKFQVYQISIKPVPRKSDGEQPGAGGGGEPCWEGGAGSFGEEKEDGGSHR